MVIVPIRSITLGSKATATTSTGRDFYQIDLQLPWLHLGNRLHPASQITATIDARQHQQARTDSDMRGLVAGGVLLGVLAIFFLVIPATQVNKDDAATSLRDQAILVAHISQALAQSSLYKVLIAQFYTEHGYFPSSVDEVDSPGLGSVSTSPDVNDVPAIETANYGDIVMHIRNADGVEVGAVILTATEDDRRRRITWKCHTAHFKEIRNHFPTCRYEALGPTQ